jgi:sugar diacid utilization regulator
MGPHAHGEPASAPAGGLEALEAVSEAVEAGAGLPEVVRAAARALDASLVLIDRSSAVLAVSARSPADERSLMRASDDVVSLDLKVADELVGRLRMRARAEPAQSVLRLVTTLVASEVERLRAPERASEEAASAFVRDVLAGRLPDSRDLLARGKELGINLDEGGTVVVVRAHPLAPADDSWRGRLLALAERSARAAAPGTLTVPAEHGGEQIVLLVPDPRGEAGQKVAQLVLRELESGMQGFSFAVGRSRVAADPSHLPRAGHEALLATNVVEGDAQRSLLAYDEAGTYRILLPYLSEDPSELERFYSETVEPLAAYDEQYETDLVGTLETFLECDGNVGATASRLFTHRHTVRYRLERVRELSGLDVAHSDGREKLSLGLKARRVLGIPALLGPARERGAAAGRVVRDAPDR